jgi:mono/diheme cytochrome c family protein
MNRTWPLVAVGSVLAGAVLLRATTLPAQNSAGAAVVAHNSAADQYSAWQTFKLYCTSCHVGPRAPAGLNLQALDLGNLDENGATWEKLLRKLRNREMPPAGLPRPNEAGYQALVRYIEGERDRLVDAKPNPGRLTIHRLNRTEYANTIRDLLAIEVDVSELLPADDIGYGFDNIGDVLNVSPLLLERYLAAAGKISRAAVGDTTVPASYRTYTIPHGLDQEDRMDENMPLGSRGGTSVRHLFPVDGEYEISLTLQSGRYDEPLGFQRERKLDLRLDGKRLERFTIAVDHGTGLDTRVDATPVHGDREAPDANLKVRLPVKAGTRTIIATFLKDSVVPEGIVNRKDKAFFEGLGSITVGGPFTVQGPGDTPSRQKIFICHPAASADEQACAEKVISNLAHRAYRRPIAADDLPPLLAQYRKGAASGGFETGIRLALKSILVTPEFVFRMEFDPPDAAPGSVHRVSDIELASRLSYFLWSSMPDDELLAVAERGDLSKPEVMQAQVRRMLAHPRSKALVTNFIGQWLFLRNLARIQPDPVAFPAFDENLRSALGEETELLVESTLREDRSIADLLNTNYTFVNQRLAEHYGIQGIYGNEFRRVAITDPNRQGLLGQASILAVTSYPNRTAPTIRGKWLLEQLLGTPPPPPPPNVPSLKDDASVKNMTMRQRMEQHRANPSCAVCHRLMDPLGFALENFDGLGRWRDTAGPGKEKIDSSGVLPDGTKFDGPAELRQILVSKREQFVDTVTERLLTYALGRGLEEYDRPVIRRITRLAAADDYRWSSVILGVIESAPFQMRRATNAASN